jgi:hypothetical protein
MSLLGPEVTSTTKSMTLAVGTKGNISLAIALD